MVVFTLPPDIAASEWLLCGRHFDITTGVGRLLPADGDSVNAVACAFYEHLADHGGMRKAIPPKVGARASLAPGVLLEP